MSEGEIRQYAELMALVAEMEAEKAHVAGMRSENEGCILCGNSPAYGMYHFAGSESNLNVIAERMRKEI